MKCTGSILPPLVHFCIAGCILPRTPAMSPEGGKRAHGAPQKRAICRHLSDAVHFFLLHLTRASRLTLALSTLRSHAMAGKAIWTLMIPGPIQLWSLRKGHIAAMRRVPIQGSCVICRGAGACAVTKQRLFLRLQQRESSVEAKRTKKISCSDRPSQCFIVDWTQARLITDFKLIIFSNPWFQLDSKYPGFQ